MKRLFFIIGSLFWACGGANCTDVSVEVNVEIAGNAEAWFNEHVVVYAISSESDQLVDFSKLSSIKSETKVVSKWLLTGLADGVHNIQVRDEPNMIGSYIFAQRSIEIPSSKKNIELRVSLQENHVWIKPSINGKKFEELGLDKFAHEYYLVLTRKLKSDPGYTQHQSIPITWNQKKEEFGSQFYFIEDGEYDCKIVRIQVGPRSKKEEIHQIFRIPSPVPEVLEFDFVKQ